MPTANAAKPTSDAAGEVQTTMGDMVPEQDDVLEELVGRYLAAKVASDKATETVKALKAEIRDVMVQRELDVYHCRTADRKVTAKDELTVKIVKDTPDGEEG